MRGSNAAVLRHKLFAVGKTAKPVDGRQVSFGAGFEDIRADPAAAHLLPVVVELDVHFALRVLPLTDGADAIVGQAGTNAGETLDRGVNCIDRPVADAGVANAFAVAVAQLHRRRGDAVRPAGHLDALQLPQAG